MRYFIFLLCLIFVGVLISISSISFFTRKDTKSVLSTTKQQHYWFILERKSQREVLYVGVPGNRQQSKVIKEFAVKTGVPGQKPTPLPQLVGREYWKIVKKEDSSDNEETAPYFLTLDVPGIEEEPYGPVPYEECNGQCYWELPGYFGLHGVNGDMTRLSEEDSGSSGCIRHTDEDITYLYNLLDPQKEEIRYYVEDR